MNILGELDPEDLIDIASRMAQALQDVADDAIEAGCSQPGIQSLVDEWETEFFAKTALSWKNVLADKDNAPGIAALAQPDTDRGFGS